MKCLVCDQPAQWVRHTQFAGDHPYCNQHAQLESDFQENDSYTYWTYHENSQIQTPQPSHELGSLQAVGSLEEEQRPQGRAEAKSASQGCRSTIQGLGNKMTDKHKIAYNYAMAMRLQRVGEERVSDAFAALGSDNQIFGLAEPLEAAYNDLVLELLGPELFEWVMWWIYETEYGTKNMEFIVQGQSYDPTTMTMYKFLMLVDPPHETMGS